jgi:alpha-mannosidase
MSSSSRSFLPFLVSRGTYWSLFFSRELIAEGKTGGLVIFQDRPNAFDAWGELPTYYFLWVIRIYLNWIDVDIHHLETAQPLEFARISVVSQGPLRAAVRAEMNYGQSTISVTVRGSWWCLSNWSNEVPWKISLDATTGEFFFHELRLSIITLPLATVKENSRSLFNFEALVDWHQRHEFLKCKLMCWTLIIGSLIFTNFKSSSHWTSIVTTLLMRHNLATFRGRHIKTLHGI